MSDFIAYNSHPPKNGDIVFPSSPEDKKQLAALWKEIFHDSDDFIKLFFDHIYAPDDTLVVKKENNIIAALYMVTYDVLIDGKPFKSKYICGVGTHPAERGKGLMNALMTEAIQAIRRNGIPLALLIPAEPWLFDVYKKNGFTHAVNDVVETYVFSQLPTCTAEYRFTSASCPTSTFGNEYEIYNRLQRERKNAVLHDINQYNAICSDLAHEHGGVFVVSENDQPIGMAFVKPESEHTVSIKNMVCDRASAQNALIHYIFNLYNARKIEVHVPANAAKATTQSVDRKIRPYGLACILNKQQIPDLFDLFMSLMLD